MSEKHYLVKAVYIGPCFRPLQKGLHTDCLLAKWMQSKRGACCQQPGPGSWDFWVDAFFEKFWVKKQFLAVSFGFSLISFWFLFWFFFWFLFWFLFWFWIVNLVLFFLFFSKKQYVCNDFFSDFFDFFPNFDCNQKAMLRVIFQELSEIYGILE